jgi:hypothetical protein
MVAPLPNRRLMCSMTVSLLVRADADPPWAVTPRSGEPPAGHRFRLLLAGTMPMVTPPRRASKSNAPGR